MKTETENPFSKAIKDAANAEARARTAELAKRRHYVFIFVRGCETDRDCYCTVTHGRDHREDDFPWVLENGTYQRGKTPEKPLEHPVRPGEDAEEYRTRLAQAESWSEGYDAACQERFTGNEETNPYLEP